MSWSFQIFCLLQFVAVAPVNLTGLSIPPGSSEPSSGLESFSWTVALHSMVIREHEHMMYQNGHV